MASYDRRTFLSNGLKTGAALGAAGVGGTLLGACGSSGGNPPLSTLGTQAAHKVGISTTKPKMGGSVTFGTEAEETGVDPTNAHFDSTGVLYARCVYDPLAIILQDGSVAPYLAESITPNSSYTKWQIKVRPNVLFHDGTPCDGAAVTYCMREFIKSALTNFAFTDYVSTKDPTKSAVQVDKYTCQINMEQRWVPFPYWLAGYIGGQIAYMFSPKQFEKGEAVLNLHPIGTGPFMLQQWTTGTHFQCVRNPHYWRKDKWGQRLPYLDSFTYKPIPDVSSRYSALESGTIDIMHTDDDRTIQQIGANKSLVALGDNEVPVGEPDVTMAMVRCNDKVMKDLRLRKALAYGTNQAAANQVIGRGITHPTNGPFPAPSPYASDTGYPSYDPVKARSYIQSWMRDNGGQKPTIHYTTTDTPISKTNATFFQQMWEGVGFNVIVGQVEQAALINDAIAGSFQIFAWRQFGSVDPDLNYVFWAKTAGIVNFAQNEDNVIQAKLDEARQTADQSVRVAAYQEVAKRFAADLPYIWFGRDVWYVASAKHVQNWNGGHSPAGQLSVSMLSGIVWPTEMWVS